MTAEEFARRLSDFSTGIRNDEGLIERLFVHYQQLRLWNERHSLIGPGTAEQVIERHYGESLAALSLLEPVSRLMDLGSGAGFPGWVLAAARPELEVWLVEPRQKKQAFLRSAAQKASLSCRVLGAKVGASLPGDFPVEIDLVTVRALKLQPEAWSSLMGRMTSEARVLRWVGGAPQRPPGGFVIARRVPLPGRRRSLEELRRTKDA
jgi:16S rRNA (guanine527-N7)-methyltransferase